MLLSKNPNILLFQEITPMKPKSDPKGAPCHIMKWYFEPTCHSGNTI